MSLLGNKHDPRELRRLEKVAESETPRAELRALEDVIAERRVKLRDCRDCKNYNQDESGLGFGWCDAHDQYVKLYHPPGEWFSQCTFKALRRFKPQELDRIAGAKLAEEHGNGNGNGAPVAEGEPAAEGARG